MNKTTLFFLAAFLILEGCQAQPTSMTTEIHNDKAISVGGMNVSWHYEKDLLIVDATAPDLGWVAIGFNPADDIVQTNLIMGGVADGKPYLHDRFVLGAGDHRPVADLGATPVARLIFAEEKDGATHIRFSIPIKTEDAYHYPLMAGQIIYLICAFSMEDDLKHHSRMRQHVRVRL